jgi:uncharacterized protein YceK
MKKLMIALLIPIISGCSSIDSQRMGFIEGSLSYPSEGIPETMTVCAESVQTQIEYCTNKHIVGKQYRYWEGYKLQAPPGDYFVYAFIPKQEEKYKAYYNEFVTCGINVDCQSHEKIIVTVKENLTVKDIDPIDWYDY